MLNAMKSNIILRVIILLSINVAILVSSSPTRRVQDFIKETTDQEDDGTKWAVLIAGSNGFWNYRHQADVCHAYQLLKKGGLKDENIIVFMYDDIAYNKENTFKGKIFNHPNGSDVYEGVLKDYTGKHVTADNFYAVLSGNKSAVVGGTGRVLESGPNDHVFVYYSDHGGSGILGMPNDKYIYADKLNEVLKEMHANKLFKSLLFYLEACESGSIFKGFALDQINVYAVTASNEYESSWATYCPEGHFLPHGLDACLGDLYSVSWMEDTEKHDRHIETVREQYKTVKERVAKGGPV